MHKAKEIEGPVVITIDTDLYKGVDGYGWWEVAVSEVSTIDSIKEARERYLENKKNQRYYL